MTGNRRGSWHMTEIGTLAIHPLTLTTRDFLTYSKRYGGLRFPPMYRIVTDGIAEGLTLHDVVKTSALRGSIAGRRKLKIM